MNKREREAISKLWTVMRPPAVPIGISPIQASLQLVEYRDTLFEIREALMLLSGVEAGDVQSSASFLDSVGAIEESMHRLAELSRGAK